MHVIAGSFKVKPERRDDLIKLSLGLFGPSRAEPGNISYNFFEDKGNENVFLFFEEWKSQEDIDKHFKTAYFENFMRQFPDMILGSATIKIYEVKDVKVL